MTIPTGNSKADIKAREQIISNVYRQWYEKHPSKKSVQPQPEGIYQCKVFVY